ncbi:hypothetical protein PMAYCL1PPCAC_23154, partial [Pristionchus mayeri]
IYSFRFTWLETTRRTGVKVSFRKDSHYEVSIGDEKFHSGDSLDDFNEYFFDRLKRRLDGVPIQKFSVEFTLIPRTIITNVLPFEVSQMVLGKRDQNGKFITTGMGKPMMENILKSNIPKLNFICHIIPREGAMSTLFESYRTQSCSVREFSMHIDKGFRNELLEFMGVNSADPRLNNGVTIYREQANTTFEFEYGNGVMETHRATLMWIYNEKLRLRMRTSFKEDIGYGQTIYVDICTNANVKEDEDYLRKMEERKGREVSHPLVRVFRENGDY